MATWKIDALHSEIEFKVKHLMITNVTGYFGEYDATLSGDKEDFSDAKITFESNVSSISTKNAQRDEHLKSEDFFDAANHPKITFASTEVKKKDAENFVLKGDLTIRGNTRPVELNVEYTGLTVDPYGQTKAGFELTGKINRKDFGLTWTATTEAGGLVVSDEVRLIAAVQMIKQA
ncbi:YceI family protein [Chitinophaga niabensis]|uniref:Polyisoprenoid-binding protein YceI n=1 Tax=Chitinophaga niabensis TaxID=536979 RepID=A0A1N6JE41_9BACT|nr:YceI family protein [Chitinophaga niabensis]SIO42461.1 Polyisoprenoid-binding protein YceI [Chitinophaga niabensis]